MKRILLLAGIFIAAISQSAAQCPCRSFAELTDADIQIPRLSWKTTADFIVKIKNKGSCGWEKDKVYVMVLGNDAEFKLRFDPPVYPGRYQIEVKFYAGGSMIASSKSKAIDWK